MKESQQQAVLLIQHFHLHCCYHRRPVSRSTKLTFNLKSLRNDLISDLGPASVSQEDPQMENNGNFTVTSEVPINSRYFVSGER